MKENSKNKKKTIQIKTLTIYINKCNNLLVEVIWWCFIKILRDWHQPHAQHGFTREAYACRPATGRVAGNHWFASCARACIPSVGRGTQGQTSHRHVLPNWWYNGRHHTMFSILEGVLGKEIHFFIFILLGYTCCS